MTPEKERLLAVLQERVPQLHLECAGYREEIERLRNWIADLQSGMFINCVYCGYRYGPDPGTPVAMAEVLKQHIEQCPDHPMSKLKNALTESVKLQSHYAKLLNMHDGGKRISFESPEAWMARLEEIRK